MSEASKFEQSEQISVKRANLSEASKFERSEQNEKNERSEQIKAK